MSNRVIFLDRDGVINIDTDYLHKPEDFIFLDGVFESCIYLQNLGFKIIIITNQSGIARGYYSETDYQKLTKWMIGRFNENNVNILDVIHCPHLPNGMCECRKPKPGMFFLAENKYNIDMKNYSGCKCIKYYKHYSSKKWS